MEVVSGSDVCPEGVLPHVYLLDMTLTIVDGTADWNDATGTLTLQGTQGATDGAGIRASTGQLTGTVVHAS